MKLYPKTITGVLHAQNKGACDWGWQGQLAFGCQNFINVVDPTTAQVIQVLEKHKGNIVKVKWARENYHHDINSPYTLRLASADTSGVIIVWDVAQGQAKTDFSDGNKPVQDVEWLSHQDASRDLLVALHPPYTLIVWNADTGTKLWKKSYTETLLSFSFDPFNPRNVAFLGQDCIVFIDDFTVTKTPSSNGKKFYIFSPSSQGAASSTGQSSNTNSLERKSSSKNLAQKMTRILVGESKPSKINQVEEETIALNECLQLSFHHSCRHHLLLLYPRELLILDLEINQTVGIVSLDKTSSSFSQVIPCWQRDALTCLHENGSISVRIRRKTNMMSAPASEGTGAFDDTPPNVSLDVAYDLRCQSDPLRVTRHNRVYGISVSPVSERLVSLVMSDSRVIFWEMKAVDIKSGSSHHITSPLYTPGATLSSAAQQISARKQDFPLITSVSCPKLVLTDMIGQSQLPVADMRKSSKGHSVQLKFVMTGLLNGIAAHVTTIRMCPPLTNKNWNVYEPLCALGTYSGTVQIVNVASGQIDREFSLHSCMVRDIEWAGLQNFLSFAYPNPGSGGQVKNELFHVETLSGKVTPIRTHREEETPIESLQISHLKQYFVLTFKDKPLELWDLRTLTIIRELPKAFPRPTAAVWSPSHSLKTLKKKLLEYSDETEKSMTKSTELDSSSTVSPPSSMSDSTSSTKEKKSQHKVAVREHFVITDKDGTVFHFIVEGSLISDVTKIPPESGLSTITCLAWKGDFLVFGDVDGTQCLWDLKAKISRTTPSSRGWIKKIRFAPGRENFKFFTLHNDGVVIWDINKEGKSEILHSLKSPKEIAKIVDAEWAGSDRPILATNIGCIHIFDLNLKKASSSIDQWDLPEVVFSPHLLPSKASQLLKCLLQHQPWTEEFNLGLEGMREDDEELQNAVNTQMQLIDSDMKHYIPNCQFGTAHRCLLTARLFGDESEIHFWTVALHYLRSSKAQPISKSPSRVTSQADIGDLFVPPTPGYKETNDLVVLDNPEEAERQKLLTHLFRDQPLERCYDTVVDNNSFKKYQLDRVSLHDSKRSTYDHTQKCAENYMLLGQTDRAVQLLLETEADNDSYYIDSLRACLVASIRSSGASQSTIKLVATNLIANGKLAEGVQLLCLIDKGLDACRYLQTYGAWDQAVWLAKATLDLTECSEVMKRWADHLCSTQVNQKSKALLVLLSLGQFFKVVEMLYGMRCFDRAACFIEACMEFGVLEKTTESAPLIEAVFLEYARFLTNLGLRKAAEHYCHQAGDKGQQLLKEVEILFT